MLVSVRSQIAAWLLALPVAALAGGEPVEAEPVPTPVVSAPSLDCADAVVTRVQDHYDGIEDLAADFEQRTESAVYPEAMMASGRVQFAKPGRMSWTYTAPQPSLVVSDGATLWIVDPEAKEVQVLAVNEAFLSGTAIHFLLGEGRIGEAFDVTAVECAEDLAKLRLDPKEAATYEYLELLVSPTSGEVRATHIADLLGNHTHVAFRGFRVNQNPPVENFRYTPGPDERVLRLTQ
jgi:outer membrane lipoprotein carrier protein